MIRAIADVVAVDLDACTVRLSFAKTTSGDEHRVWVPLLGSSVVVIALSAGEAEEIKFFSTGDIDER